MVLISASTAFLVGGDPKPAEASRFVAESHVLNTLQNIEGVVTLLDDSRTVKPGQIRNIVVKATNKATSKKVKAVSLNGKLLVIKGFTDAEPSNPETEVSIDELNAMSVQVDSQEQVATDILPVDTIGSSISSTEIVIEVPALPEEAVSLEDDGEIQEYEVQTGDTLASISKKFNISVDTIVWANDLKKNDVIRIGQKLVILPISGVAYTIKSGDTVSEIAEKFNISQRELSEFNDLQDGKLVIGQRIIIPGGTLGSANTNNTGQTSVVKNVPKSSTKETSVGFLSRPMKGGIKTQGIHGHNGIDIAGPIGTPILAAREGVVTLVRGGSAWNGGYGNYVVITHDNGVKTLYAHMNSITVGQGQKVVRGQQVGTLGNTGRSTGPHLHFEVRGAKNPF